MAASSSLWWRGLPPTGGIGSCRRLPPADGRKWSDSYNGSEAKRKRIHRGRPRTHWKPSHAVPRNRDRFGIKRPRARQHRTHGGNAVPQKPDDFIIRRAEPADVALILAFVQELAEYERLSHLVTATEQTLLDSLFGPPPGADVLL